MASLARIFPTTIIFALALGGCDQSAKSVNDSQENAETAILASGVRLDYIDKNVSPVEDFFGFANGQWLESTPIPADKARYGAFDILADQAQEDVKAIVLESGNSAVAKTAGTEAQQISDFYLSFMDIETLEQRGLTPLKTYWAEIGQLQNPAAISEYFAIASRRGVRTPLSFYIDTDEKNPQQYMAYFNQSGLGLPDRDYYLKDDAKSTANQKAYKAHITRMFTLAGLPNDLALAERIYAMELAIAEVHWPRTDLRDRDRTYNKRDLQQLQTMAPNLYWPTYLQAIGLEKADAVVISAPSYFENLSRLITQFPAADWQLYLKWRTLSSYANLLTADLDQEDFHFYATELRGVEEQEARWKRAVDMANGILGDAIGKLYVEKHFSPVAKERMQDLVENLRTAYHQSILELDWMGDDTKTKAIEKLKKFKPKIGYPDRWKDLSALTIKADDLFGNFLRATEFHHQLEVAKIGAPVDRNEWFMNPQTVNAYYNPGMNEIVFPAAILQPPFFNLDADDAINYGAIGAVIGHEMGHGFDDQGAKSDGDGLLQNWWTETDLQEFGVRTDKLVAQYNGFQALDDLTVNGELTQGENIGDLGGLTIAYKAYQLSLNEQRAAVLDGYTGDQRFFLGWGQVWAAKLRDEELRRRILTDPHSPPRFRVNGVLPNMPAFHQAFTVKEGDSMYLPASDQVKIW
jgi:predicted metalloendopeptidase